MKDKKKKNYNVFINAYKDAQNKEQLICNYREDLITLFACVLNRVYELTGMLEYNFNHDLTDNVLLKGLTVQTKRIMENEKCKNTSKF